MTETEHQSVHELIFQIAENSPGKIAIHLPGAQISYAELSGLIRSFALRFASHGINRNATVAIWDIGGLAFTISTLAVSLLGGRFVGASKFAMILAPQLGISHHIRNAGGTGDVQFDQTVLIDESWFTARPGMLPKWTDFEGPSSGDAIYMIAQSSGSTGAPKFMALPHGMIATRLDDGRQYDFFEYERFGCLFQVNSFPGHSIMLRVLRHGETFVGGLDPQFHIAAGTESFFGSPAQYRGFVDHIPANTPKFQQAVSLGAPMTSAFVRMARPHFEHITNVIGSTEVGYLAAIIVDRDDMDIRCVGRPIGHADVQIVDDNHQPVATRQEGMIRIRSTRNIGRYMISSDADKDVFRDGFFYPGDVGFFDEDGQLYVVGRAKDHFNLNGTKVNASRVDGMLTSRPGIKDAMAFTDVDEDGFDILAAVILCDDHANQSEIVADIKSLRNTAFFQLDVPRRIYFVPQLPRNDNGKLMRATAPNLIEGIQMNKIW